MICCVYCNRYKKTGDKAMSVRSKRRSIIPGCCVSLVATWYSLDPLKGFSSSVVFILASRNGVLPRSHLQMGVSIQ